MAKIEKLPSGNWRVRIYDKTTNSRKSFTAPTKAEVKLLAAQWENGIKAKAAPKDLTVSEAVAEYISSKENVLSPSTVRGYEIIRRNALREIADIKIKLINEKDLQLWVNSNAKRYKAKGVKNQFGLVTATLRQNKIDLDYASIRLPKGEKYEPNIPTEQEIAKILTIIEGTNIEIPVTIAVTFLLFQYF